jgi:hypothetical protein
MPDAPNPAPANRLQALGTMPPPLRPGGIGKLGMEAWLREPVPPEVDRSRPIVALETSQPRPTQTTQSDRQLRGVGLMTITGRWSAV